MTRRRLMMVALSLVFASCGGNGGSEANPSRTTSNSASAPPTNTPAPSAASTDAPGSPSITSSGGLPSAAPSTTVARVSLDELTLTLDVVATGFEQPVFATAPPGDERLFVVDQPGRIWLLDRGEPEVFLDLRDEVTFGGERGLLGLAFHPEYARNGRLYVDYIDRRGNTVVAEFTAAGATADPASRRVLLEIEQPAGNHNGGMVAFGPDGYLWIGSGDGGGANDRFGHGQRPDTLLATLLRIDVAGEPYAVPPDNPFVGGGGAPEVWAYGLRNPWRFSFDDDRIYVADVGQNRIEEIDVVSVAPGPARNFGWPIMEGSSCFSSGDCSSDGLVLPVAEYQHDEGCSVTGGFVYRGRSLPELEGHYFYGDYCAGWVRSVLVGGDGSLQDAREWFAPGTLPNLTSFGVDAAGELYVMTSGGTVWRVDRDGTS